MEQQTSQGIPELPPASSPAKSNILLIIGGIALIGLIAGTSYYLGMKSSQGKITAFAPTVTPIRRPTDSPVPTIDETANWQIYTNTELGISIKYPNSFHIITAEEIVKRDKPQIGMPFNFLKITQQENPSNFVFFTALKEAFSIEKDMQSGIKFTDVTINGMTLKQYRTSRIYPEIGSCNAYGYVLERGNLYYNLYTCDADVTTFEKMISTFQFINNK